MDIAVGPATILTNMDTFDRLEDLAHAYFTAKHEARERSLAHARLLIRHRLSPPYLGAYPMAFTSFNYLAIDRLLALLAEHQRREIGLLEADLRELTDDESRGVVRHLLELKTANLKKLEALLLPGAEPAAAPT